MAESTNTDDNAKKVIAHLMKIAQEEMNLTPEQLAGFDPDGPIVDNLELDSLRQVVLMSSIERDYGCMFDPMELQQVQTLRDLVGMILKNVPEDKLNDAHADEPDSH